MNFNDKKIAEELNEEWSALPINEILIIAKKTFGEKIVFASSLGLEDQVLTDIIATNNLNLSLFTLDTGRLFNESYDLIEQTENKYDINIKVYFPNSDKVENMVKSHGINLFKKSIENRKHCCLVRKVESLRRALAGNRAWICGLRSEQSITRSKIEIVEWDEGNGLIKINPLARWSEDEVKKYIKVNAIPYNILHDFGFPSIGCACCTRAIEQGEDVRAGRWWWEEPEKKECGLHSNKR